MGKWAKKRAKNTIKDEIYNRLSKLFKAGNGRSRNVDKRNGVDREYIYSSKTYKTYHNECKRFAVWCRKTHPEVRHLKECKKYVNEYLTYQISSGKSPWTLTTQKAALAKLYGVDYASFIATPPRERSKIKRSRDRQLLVKCATTLQLLVMFKIKKSRTIRSGKSKYLILY